MANVYLVRHDISSTDASSYLSSTFNSYAGYLLVALVTTSDTVAGGALTSSAGDTFSLVGSALRNSGGSKTYVFVADAQTQSTTSHRLTFSCSGDPATGFCVTVLAVAGLQSGVAGLSAVRQLAKVENVASGTPSVVFPVAALAENPIVAIVSNDSNPAGMTPPTGWTEKSDVGFSTPSGGHEVAAKDSGFSSNTVTWGNSASAYAAIAIELSITGAPSSYVSSATSIGPVASIGTPAARVLASASSLGPVASIGTPALFASAIAFASSVIANVAFGTPGVAVVAHPASVAAFQAGTPSAAIVVSASGVQFGEIGQPVGIIKHLATGIQSTAIGTPGALVRCYPSGFSSPTFGTPLAKVLATPKNRFAYARAYRFGDGAVVLSRISPRTKN